MSLVEVNEIEIHDTDAPDAAAIRATVEKWEHTPASVISHHGEACCAIAREWVIALDYSQLNAANSLTGPRWLRHKFAWGPSRWPLYWCEAVEQKTLDCGALAALARELFIARGNRSYAAQFIQRYTEDATRHWYKKWNGDESSVHWIKENLIYHEGCAVSIQDNEIKLWDPTASWWINPKQFEGYGSLLAVRIFDARQTLAPSVFNWGGRRIVANRWQNIA